MENTCGTGHACRRLGVSQPYVLQLIKSGRLKATHTAVGYLVDLTDLERLAEERAERAAAKTAKAAVAA